EAYARERYEAPQGQVEQILAHIWQELLGVERVGRHDNFFALGGHSLLAMRMIQLLRLGYEHDVPLTALYESPTIAGLADRLKTPGQTIEQFRSREMLLPLRSEGDGPALFCMHPGAGIGWAYLGLLRHLPGHPIYTLQSRSYSQADYAAESIHAMAADYLTKIQAVQPTGPYHLLGWSIGGYLAHAVATLLQEKGEQVGLLVILDSYPVPEVDRASPIPNGDELEQFIRRHLGELGYTTRDLDDSLVASMAKELEMSALLMREFKPAVFHGNVLFFRACDDTADRPPIDAWKPFVAGGMAVHGIDCDHGAMMQTGPLTQIGPIVADALAAGVETSVGRADDLVCDV
ncbi:alpha/beta fold hydrolase, partial [Dyella flagellata]